MKLCKYVTSILKMCMGHVLKCNNDFWQNYEYFDLDNVWVMLRYRTAFLLEFPSNRLKMCMRIFWRRKLVFDEITAFVLEDPGWGWGKGWGLARGTRASPLCLTDTSFNIYVIGIVTTC